MNLPIGYKSTTHATLEITLGGLSFFIHEP